MVSGAAGAALYFSPAIAAAFQDFGHSIHQAAPTATPSAASAGAATASWPPAAVAGSASAFTVLLLGSDNDAKFASNVVLTQSMILARVDPVTKHVTMLSIPRDLYVPLSTGGTDKIDKAYLNGGADASIATVERDFKVHIDHYAWIGLLGLVHLIDKVGGVDVVASNPVLDDFYPKDLGGNNPYAHRARRGAARSAAHGRHGGAPVRALAARRPAQRLRPLRRASSRSCSRCAPRPSCSASPTFPTSPAR